MSNNNKEVDQLITSVIKGMDNTINFVNEDSKEDLKAMVEKRVRDYGKEFEGRELHEKVQMYLYNMGIGCSAGYGKVLEGIRELDESLDECEPEI